MGRLSPPARQSGGAVAGRPRRKPAGAHATGAANHPYRRAPARQREGLGQALVARAVAQSDGLDYLSVSFGYTPELGRFWQRCGFTLVRLGTHREASSGCYTAMALYPLSSAGHELVLRESQRLTRDEFWLREWREALFPQPEAPAAMLTEDDWLDV
jgi:tRNA(Met) cytidine acetyltransferase